MDRIAIVGCGGSGKTYLACQLAALLDLPLTHLDVIFYDHSWNSLPQKDFADRQRQLVAAPRHCRSGYKPPTPSSFSTCPRSPA
ncbi:hypothetical protein OH799_06940 [Nocardia sp. NBC_00881]|uniref:hypothetical protein n=1 Tax=Nocardia sp. NBC_00881 TaxID=2975995 RepID=UPI003863F169|nr:hypothetical protein OH799_06940 [Nocardia sp. NBC_00881]